MKPSFKFICGGGWNTTPAKFKPLTGLFMLLAAIGLAVCMFGSVLLGLDHWPLSFAELGWLGVTGIIAELILIGLAIYFMRTEKPRGAIFMGLNQERDRHNLY